MRTQFSISMDTGVRDRLELIAGLSGKSLSAYIEDLGRAQIASISDETWVTIEEIRDALKKHGHVTSPFRLKSSKKNSRKSSRLLTSPND